MIRAADAGRDEIVQILLRYKADVHSPTKYGDTALTYASQFCQARTVQLLIDSDSKINHANDRGETALHLAADRGRADVIRVLLTAGADLNIKKQDGNTALMSGARRSSEVVKELINARADLNLKNSSGHTALLIAATWGPFEAVVNLLEAGADLEMASNEGETALMSAARCNRNKAVLHLLKSGARVDLVHRDGTLNSVLMYICRFCLTDTALHLLENKKPAELMLNHSNSVGHTALTYACSCENPQVVRLLIELGAKVNVRTNYKDTPLILATKFSDLLTVQYLTDAGAKINVLNKGYQTPLLNAVKRDRINMVQLLLWRGAQVTMELHYATLQGKNEAVQVLMQNGAAPTIQNVEMFFTDQATQSSGHFPRGALHSGQDFSMFDYQVSPLCIALLSGYPDIARFFLTNWFLTTFDTSHLLNSRCFRQLLVNKNLDTCLEILDNISFHPWRLQTLSFVSGSTIMGDGPDRAENIQKLKLPDFFQRRFQFRDCSAFSDKNNWKDVSYTV